jgi:hypothetical protein
MLKTLQVVQYRHLAAFFVAFSIAPKKSLDEPAGVAETARD